jgi:DNA-binding TFAR19-related protein (PDSD5 family)
LNDQRSAPTLDQWAAISPLLDQALELEGEERLSWIRSQDPDLAYQLELLLKEHRFLADEGFLENRVIELPPTDVSLAGQTLGVYT